MEREIILKEFQHDYIYSPARHPAFIAAWGTGKTMSALMRAQIYSKFIPDNLGIIFRKEYTDLRDSTLRDYELYTGMKVDSERNATYKNGSMIMFRHIEELNSAILQNTNLGWFYIEQAEELPTDREFFLLFGRLRRQLSPSKEFQLLQEREHMPLHTGFIIGNVAGDNWIKKIWKDKPDAKYQLIEAQTKDNADILPPDFLEGLEDLKTRKPEIYRRYVLNDWMAEVEGKVFNNVINCVAGEFEEPKSGFDYILGVDLAKSMDFTVLSVMCRQTKHLVYFKRLESGNKTSWYEQKEQIKAVALKYNNALAVVDASGPGDPIVEDLLRSGVGVWHHQKANGDSIPGVKFTNIIKEDMVERLKVAIENRLITFPRVDVLLDELNDFECEMTASRKFRYQAPDGKHDDCVISLALAVWALLGSIYDTYVEPKPKTTSDLFWDRVKKDTARFNERTAVNESIHELSEEGARAV
jgi:hypothetical protein